MSKRLQTRHTIALASLLERFSNPYALSNSVKGGFYFHPSDKDLSLGARLRKKPLNGLFSKYTHWRTALMLAGWLALAASAQPSQPAKAVVLDRVVAVVNNQAILASDVDEEMRLAVLDPGRAGLGVLTPKLALRQLISRALIQQQIRQEDAQAIEPSQAEVDARLKEIRNQVPACVHLNCATEEGWKAFLAANRLTQERVESYLRHRIQILRFIEGFRLRQRRLRSITAKRCCPSMRRAKRSRRWRRWLHALRRFCCSGR